MASIKITYRLTPAGQKASLHAGGDGKAVQSFTLKPNSPEWADAVELAEIGTDGDGKIEMNGYRGAYRCDGDKIQYADRDYPRYDAPATVGQLIADYRREKALDAAGYVAYREDVAARHEADVARVLACPLADLILQPWPGGYQIVSGPWDDSRLATLKAELEAEIERLTAEFKANKEAEAAKAEAEKKSGRDSLASWVREHGSELSRLRLEDGYDCWVSSAREEYADAIAAKIAEASGLTLDDGDLYERCDTVNTEDRKCPVVAEIKSLRDVRAVLPEGCAAKLVWTRYTGGDLDEGIGRAEIEITIPVPGARDETRILTLSE